MNRMKASCNIQCSALSVCRTASLNLGGPEIGESVGHVEFAKRRLRSIGHGRCGNPTIALPQNPRSKERARGKACLANNLGERYSDS
jgi:hypothetical protein